MSRDDRWDMNDFLIETHYTRWVFQPLTDRGKRWLSNNLYGTELIVDKRNGPHVFRALRADGLDALVANPRERNVPLP